jgi:CHAT domain-containing protein
MRSAARRLAALSVLGLLMTGGAGDPFSFLPSQTPAAQTVDAHQVDRWLAEAETLQQQGKSEAARLVYQRAADAARASALHPQEAAALCGVGSTSITLASYADAKTAGQRCLEMAKLDADVGRIGRALVTLSTAAYYLGDYAEAAQHAERAIAAFETTGDRRGRAVATLMLTRTTNRKPEEDWALLERAIEDSRAAGARDTEARALHSWGDGLFAAGRYEESLEKLEAAAQIFESTGDSGDLGTVYNSVGRLYRAHGRLDEALRWQLKALELHESANQPFQLLQSFNAVATVYSMRGETSKARPYYERALALAEKTSSPRIQDFIRANLTVALMREGDNAQAAAILEGVIARKLDAFPTLRYVNLSHARRRLGQIPEALAAAQSAVEHCKPGSPECISALHQRAAVQNVAGNVGAALEDLRAALAAIEEMRTKLVPADFFKQDFHQVLGDTYSQAIEIQIAQKQDRDALETAELARARAFLDLLASRNVQVAAPAVTGDVVSTGARLRSTFVLYWVAEDALYVWTVSPAGRIDARKVNVLRSKLTELIRTTTPQQDAPGVRAGSWRELYDILIGPIRSSLPRQEGSLLTIVPHGPLLNLSFAALQDGRGRYLLEDFTIHYVPAAAVLQLTGRHQRAEGRRGNFLLVADPPVPVQSRLDRKLPSLPGARTEAAAIGQLVPKTRQTVLQGNAATEAGVRARVGGKAVLHFATHAIIHDATPFSSFLALGTGSRGPAPTTRGVRDPNDRGPATRGADPGSARLSTGAGERAPSVDPAADGRLTAEEIYQLNLNAELVVLSACRSGDGPVTGDGIATFARAFMSAGTPTLVASLWGVADRPADRLLPEFYRAWIGGQPKAQALRAAQLRLLRDLRENTVKVETPLGIVPIPEHPIFWAGFALIGEPR